MLKRWQLWAGLIISSVCLYIVLRRMQLDQVWLALKTARYWWIVPGVAVYFFAVWARTWRWHYLLRPIHDTGGILHVAGERIVGGVWTCGGGKGRRINENRHHRRGDRRADSGL